MANILLTRRRLLCFAAALPVASPLFANPGVEVTVLDPTRALDVWTERNRSKAVSWQVSGEGSNAAVEVRSDSAFAILTRDVELEMHESSRLTWSWRVDEMSENADLKSIEMDDLGAGVALVFGKPGLLRKVPPTLIYTWAGAANANDEFVSCRRHPDAMRFVIVRSGLESQAGWHSESRDVAKDFRAAFGSSPPDHIHAVALWSDSDQTHASTRASFGPITLHTGL